MTADGKIIGERIRLAREQAGLTREQLAVATRCSYSSIVKWEHGQSVKAENLARIARVTGRTLDWFTEHLELDLDLAIAGGKSTSRGKAIWPGGMPGQARLFADFMLPADCVIDAREEPATVLVGAAAPVSQAA